MSQRHVKGTSLILESTTLPATGIEGEVRFSSGSYHRYSGSSWIEMADISSSQVFTNKDYDGGTASNASRIRLPKATKAVLDGLFRVEGVVWYATDEKKAYIDDGVDLNEIGSGGSSFRIQSVTTGGSTVVKGGTLIDSLGREFATYDGAGLLDSDFAGDITIALGTLVGAPVNDTTYYLYIDTDGITPLTTSDSGRILYPVEEANLVAVTTSPENQNLSRYVPINYVRYATAQWSDSIFGATAFRRHDAYIANEPFNYVVNPSAKRGVTEGITLTNATVTKGSTLATFGESYFIATNFSALDDAIEWSMDTLQAKHNNIMFQWSFSAQLNLVGSGVYTAGLWDGSAYVGDTVTLIDGSVVNASGSAVLDTAVTYTIRIVSDASANASDTIYVSDVKYSNEGRVTGEASTPWTDYTPTDAGLDISASNLEWMQKGTDMWIRGDFTTGAVSGTEAQLSLPNSLTVGGTTTSTVNAGYVAYAPAQGVSRTEVIHAVTTKDDAFINFANDFSNGNNEALTPQNGNAAFRSTSRYAMTIGPIPIAEWSGQQTNFITESVTKANARFSTGGWTSIPSVASSVALEIATWKLGTVTGGGSFDGTAYTIPADGVYDISAMVRFNDATLAADDCYISLNGTISGGLSRMHYDFNSASYPSMQTRYVGTLTKGDQISVYVFHNDAASVPFRNVDFENIFSVTRVPDYSAGSPVGFGLATADQAGLVSQESSGTWIPTKNAGANTTGTAAFGTATWYSIGKMVFVSISNITGLTTTSVNGRTYISISSSTLPNVPVAPKFAGSSFVTYSATPNYSPGGVSTNGTDIFIGFRADYAESININGIGFSYVMD